MPSPNNLQSFTRSEPLTYLVGKVDNRGLFAFNRGEPFLGIGTSDNVRFSSFFLVL